MDRSLSLSTGSSTIVPKALLSPMLPLGGGHLVGRRSHPFAPPAAQVLPAPLLLDLVEGGAWLVGGGQSLLRPIVDQSVKVFGERALLIVVVAAAVVGGGGLDPSEPRDWLRGLRGRDRGERRLRLIGGRLSRGALR